MNKDLKNTVSILLISLSLSFLSGCAQVSNSSRDITKEELAKYDSPFIESAELRSPADIKDCANYVVNFFKPKKVDLKNVAIPELTQLSPEVKKFPNGKQYTEYTANINVMTKYPDYDDFLKNTIEVLFEPSEPFGHIRLRIGETIYSFNNVKWTSMNKYSPKMNKSNNPDIPSSTGFVFEADRQKMADTKKEIEAFYKSSVSHNVPPFDAYSPLLKIVESDGVLGKKLKYESTSPKYGNSQELKGKIIEADQQFFIDTENGIKLPLEKQGNDYYLQSYSCSTSAAYILKKYFDITIGGAGAAKSVNKALLKGNYDGGASPIAIIKYYEDAKPL